MNKGKLGPFRDMHYSMIEEVDNLKAKVEVLEKFAKERKHCSGDILWSKLEAVPHIDIRRIHKRVTTLALCFVASIVFAYIAFVIVCDQIEEIEQERHRDRAVIIEECTSTPYKAINRYR